MVQHVTPERESEILCKWIRNLGVKKIKLELNLGVKKIQIGVEIGIFTLYIAYNLFLLDVFIDL